MNITSWCISNKNCLNHSSTFNFEFSIKISKKSKNKGENIKQKSACARKCQCHMIKYMYEFNRTSKLINKTCTIA